MTSFQTTVQIDAAPADVWRLLIDTARWSTWDREIRRVEGTLEPGGHLVLHRSGSSRPFALDVTEWQPERRVVLTGGMPLGLFTGRRVYSSTPLDGGTRFEMAETYTGPLAGVIGRSIPDLQPSFDAFAEGLRSEAQHA